MKKLLVAAVLGAVLVTPAFAQHDPDVHERASHKYRSTVPSGDIYYGRRGNIDPDIQQGGSQWKTLHHRAHRASRPAKRK